MRTLPWTTSPGATRPNPRAMMSDGDPYDPGKNMLRVLSASSAGRQDRSSSFCTLASGQDGSPRLTAYEYQGMTRSKCFRAGKPGQRITCISCHEMHGGDPKGQLTGENENQCRVHSVSSAICNTGATGRAHETSGRIERKPLLQLPHAVNRF